MKVLLSRTYDSFFTKGILFVVDDTNLIFHCVTIELPNNGNQKNVSCILEGRYWCVKYLSPTKGWVFLLIDVPGRDAIEIHVGNYVSGSKIDSRGCILPGYWFDDINKDGLTDVINSRKAMNKLFSVLPDKFEILITS